MLVFKVEKLQTQIQFFWRDTIAFMPERMSVCQSCRGTISPVS